MQQNVKNPKVTEIRAMSEIRAITVQFFRFKNDVARIPIGHNFFKSSSLMKDNSYMMTHTGNSKMNKGNVI
jgi:hypothetical protein